MFNVIKVLFIFLMHVEGKIEVGFVVNNPRVEQLSIDNKRIKHAMYRTADFMSTSEAKKRPSY